MIIVAYCENCGLSFTTNDIVNNMGCYHKKNDWFHVYSKCHNTPLVEEYPFVITSKNNKTMNNCECCGHKLSLSKTTCDNCGKSYVSEIQSSKNTLNNNNLHNVPLIHRKE